VTKLVWELVQLAKVSPSHVECVLAATFVNSLLRDRADIRASRGAHSAPKNRVSSPTSVFTLQEEVYGGNNFCIPATSALAEAKRQLLALHPYEFVTATDFKQIEAACANIRFDLALIGENFEPAIKIAIFFLLRKHCPQVPILEIYKDIPVIEDSEYVKAGSPDEIVKAVQRILVGK
jgi:hypothetical protein